MSLFNLIADIPSVYPLYFFYGATFFVLGISIIVKDMKGSDLKLAGSLWLLGAFGFTHGAREWLELFPLIVGEHLSLQEIFLVKSIGAALLVLSFIFLLQFGLSLARVLDGRRVKWLKAVPAGLFFIWFFRVWNHGFTMDMQFLRQVEIGCRHTFGLAGGLVTAYGLIAYSHKVRGLSHIVSKKLHHAGIAFAFYGIFAGLLPSNYFFIPFLPFPVEALRGLSAIFITCFIIKGLNIFDIEMRHKIEQQTRLLVQAEKLSSLGQLAAGIAHEINNPLTNASLGIQTLKDTLKHRSTEKEIVERLSAVERGIDKASAIAQELLQFSRQRESEFVPVNINNVVYNALMLLKYKLKNIVIDQDLAPVADVMGDPGKLEQVFINILSNSVEAMPEGGKIAISTQQKNGSIHVQVTDTGTGISKEHLTRVFDPFYSTKEVGMGTGLGLSICYGIIRQHRGAIELTSAAGKGTTVIIKIPEKVRYEENNDR